MGLPGIVEDAGRIQMNQWIIVDFTKSDLNILLDEIGHWLLLSRQRVKPEAGTQMTGQCKFWIYFQNLVKFQHRLLGMHCAREAEGYVVAHLKCREPAAGCFLIVPDRRFIMPPFELATPDKPQYLGVSLPTVQSFEVPLGQHIVLRLTISLSAGEQQLRRLRTDFQGLRKVFN